MRRRNRRPRIGQWYARRDTREVFQVTGLDERSRTVEVQTRDGDLDEIELKQWRVIPVALVEPPEDWSEAIDTAMDDCDDPLSQRTGTGVTEAWEDPTAEEEIDFLTERADPEHLL